MACMKLHSHHSFFNLQEYYLFDHNWISDENGNRPPDSNINRSVRQENRPLYSAQNVMIQSVTWMHVMHLVKRWRIGYFRKNQSFQKFPIHQFHFDSEISYDHEYTSHSSLMVWLIVSHAVTVGSNEGLHLWVIRNSCTKLKFIMNF